MSTAAEETWRPSDEKQRDLTEFIRVDPGWLNTGPMPLELVDRYKKHLRKRGYEARDGFLITGSGFVIRYRKGG